MSPAMVVNDVNCWSSHCDSHQCLLQASYRGNAYLDTFLCQHHISWWHSTPKIVYVSYSL